MVQYRLSADTVYTNYRIFVFFAREVLVSRIDFLKETKRSLGRIGPVNFKFAEEDLRFVFLLKLVLFAKTEYRKEILI